jgi:hypothetical protein
MMGTAVMRMVDTVEGKLELSDSNWADHTVKISTAWSKSLASVLETARFLIAAKAEMPHGSFTAMVNLKLPFGPATAQCLIAIGNHAFISNANHGQYLPSSWRTLYELTKCEPDVLREAIEDGSINPKMERSDVIELRGETKPRKATLPKTTDPYDRCMSETKVKVEDALAALAKKPDAAALRVQLFLGLRTLLDGLERGKVGVAA